MPPGRTDPPVPREARRIPPVRPRPRRRPARSGRPRGTGPRPGARPPASPGGRGARHRPADGRLTRTVWRFLPNPRWAPSGTDRAPNPLSDSLPGGLQPIDPEPWTRSRRRSRGRATRWHRPTRSDRSDPRASPGRGPDPAGHRLPVGPRKEGREMPSGAGFVQGNKFKARGAAAFLVPQSAGTRGLSCPCPIRGPAGQRGMRRRNAIGQGHGHEKPGPLPRFGSRRRARRGWPPLLPARAALR